MSDDRILEAAANDGVQLLGRDLERIQQGMHGGVDGVGRLILELLRSRGALLRVALKIANAGDVPEEIRAEVQLALQDAVLR